MQGVRNHASVSGHPCVLTLRGAFEDDSTVYVLTELCVEGALFSQEAGV